MNKRLDGDAERRNYHSPLREEQARQTRDRIVDALVEQLAESGRTDFAMNEVATRAGVSVRTIYRYFPTREELLAAIDERVYRAVNTPPPRNADDVFTMTRKLFQWFEEHPDRAAVGHMSGLGRELRKHGRTRRAEETRRLLHDWAGGLSDREKRMAYAVFRTMFGSFTWLTMRQELGMSSRETSEATLWVMRLVFEDIERRIAASGGNQEPDGEERS